MSLKYFYQLKYDCVFSSYYGETALQKNGMSDDEEVLLNVLRCQLTY